MMKEYRVLPEWHEHCDLRNSEPPIIAEFASDAAEQYVFLNDANLDYPSTIEVKTLEIIDGAEAVRRFCVVRVPAFSASEIIPESR